MSKEYKGWMVFGALTNTPGQIFLREEEKDRAETFAIQMSGITAEPYIPCRVTVTVEDDDG